LPRNPLNHARCSGVKGASSGITIELVIFS